MIQVGSLVECICDFPVFEFIPRFELPVKGLTYTVRFVDTSTEITGLYLEEIINPKFDVFGNDEPTFAITFFRELQPPMEINIEEIIKETQTA